MGWLKKKFNKAKDWVSDRPAVKGAVTGLVTGGPLGVIPGAVSGAAAGKVGEWAGGAWKDVTGQTAAENAAAAQAEGVRRAIEAQQQGTKQGIGALDEATQNAIAAQRAARGQGRSALEDYQQQQMALLNPTIQTGQSAMDRMGVFSGLGGADAQQQAISGLENSPLFQSLVQQGEDAMLQSSAATGGIRGGNTQGALAQYRPQMLQQQIQQQMANLGGLAGMGQNALGQASSGLMATGQGLMDSYNQQGATTAGLYGNQGQAAAGLYGQQGASIASLYNQGGQQQAALDLAKYQMPRDFLFDLAGLGIEGAKAYAGGGGG